MEMDTRDDVTASIIRYVPHCRVHRHNIVNDIIVNTRASAERILLLYRTRKMQVIFFFSFHPNTVCITHTQQSQRNKIIIIHENFTNSLFVFMS